MADTNPNDAQPKSTDKQYQPSPDDQRLIAEVNDRFTKMRSNREPFEQQWFINAATLRNNPDVVWNEAVNRLDKRPVPPHRSRIAVNRILPKIRARIAKFTKNRPVPVVVPASHDREDHLNARATQRVLDFIGRKQKLESKYHEALLWSQTTGKGYWWFYWDPSKIGRVQETDPLTGQPTVKEAELGDACVEVGSPFEIFISDPGKLNIADQPEIMRVRLLPVEDVRSRYKEKGPFIKGDSESTEVFQYERQIANIAARTGRGGASGAGGFDSRDDEKKGPSHVMVKELFTKPCGKYPKGRYIVVAGGVLLRSQEELPYGFSDMANPYPVVEFNDTMTAGQYWPTTHIEQMIPLQKEYNSLRRGLQEHLRLLKHPKIFVPEQFRISKGSWNSEAGEVIRYVAMPGIPAPTPWNPPQISGDVWRLVDVMVKEFDDVTNIYPAMQGGVGQASSGFQTNLLQEAADSVHSPDVRQHELSLEDAYLKIRRIIKQGWDVPRLINVTGRNYEAEVFEFSSDQIDENADIIIQTGSALSNQPSVRSQQVFELYNSGLIGDPADPETRRKGLSLLNLNTQDSLQEMTHRDESLARLENLEFGRGVPVDTPKPWEDHNIHWTYHTDQLKSPEIRQWPQERVLALVEHVVRHAKYINPQNALMIANEFGLQQLAQEIMMTMAPPAPPQGGPEGPPPQDPNAPPMPVGPEGPPAPEMALPPPEGVPDPNAIPPQAPLPF